MMQADLLAMQVVPKVLLCDGLKILAFTHLPFPPLVPFCGEGCEWVSI